MHELLKAILVIGGAVIGALILTFAEIQRYRYRRRIQLTRTTPPQEKDEKWSLPPTEK